MANEKLMILKMLEEGKITAEEAANLMDAAAGTKSSQAKQRNGQTGANTTPRQDNQYSRNDASGNSSTYNNTNSQNQSGRSYHQGGGYTYTGAEDFAAGLGRKFDTIARDMEPKIQKLTETVVEKTANFADSISKSLSQPSIPREPVRPESRQYGSYTPPPSKAASPSGHIQKDFEILVLPGHCELNLSGLNGDVMINGYNGDKISAKINYKPKFNAASIELMKLGDKYYLNYDEDNFEFVTIDAYVPEKLFKSVKIETLNGRISIKGIVTDALTVAGQNSRCELNNIYAASLMLDTSNGECDIFGVSGQSGKFDVFNGALGATGIDFENLNVSVNNGPVSLNIDYFNKFSDYTWVIEASNGKLVMNLPSSAGLGYHIKAKTSLSNVKLGLINMDYIANNPNFIEAKSLSYETTPKKVRLSAETSNAPLTIN